MLFFPSMQWENWENPGKSEREIYRVLGGMESIKAIIYTLACIFYYIPKAYHLMTINKKIKILVFTTGKMIFKFIFRLVAFLWIEQVGKRIKILLDR